MRREGLGMNERFAPLVGLVAVFLMGAAAYMGGGWWNVGAFSVFMVVISGMDVHRRALIARVVQLERDMAKVLIIQYPPLEVVDDGSEPPRH